MKNLLVFIFAALFSSLTIAEMLDEVPDTYCDPEYYNCSAESQIITQNYFNGLTPNEITKPTLFTGSCFMVSANYDGSYRHHAYIYLRPNKDQLDFFGEFAFFFNEDPYANLTIDELNQKFKEPSTYFVEKRETHWQADTNEDPPYQYFFKRKHKSHLHFNWLLGN